MPSRMSIGLCRWPTRALAELGLEPAPGLRAAAALVAPVRGGLAVGRAWALPRSSLAGPAPHARPTPRRRCASGHAARRSARVDRALRAEHLRPGGGAAGPAALRSWPCAPKPPLAARRRRVAPAAARWPPRQPAWRRWQPSAPSPPPAPGAEAGEAAAVAADAAVAANAALRAAVLPLWPWPRVRRPLSARATTSPHRPAPPAPAPTQRRRSAAWAQSVAACRPVPHRWRRARIRVHARVSAPSRHP